MEGGAVGWEAARESCVRMCGQLARAQAACAALTARNGGLAGQLEVRTTHQLDPVRAVRTIKCSSSKRSSALSEEQNRERSSRLLLFVQPVHTQSVDARLLAPSRQAGPSWRHSPPAVHSHPRAARASGRNAQVRPSAARHSLLRQLRSQAAARHAQRSGVRRRWAA